MTTEQALAYLMRSAVAGYEVRILPRRPDTNHWDVHTVDLYGNVANFYGATLAEAIEAVEAARTLNTDR